MGQFIFCPERIYKYALQCDLLPIISLRVSVSGRESIINIADTQNRIIHPLVHYNKVRKYIYFYIPNAGKQPRTKVGKSQEVCSLQIKLFRRQTLEERL